MPRGQDKRSEVAHDDRIFYLTVLVASVTALTAGVWVQNKQRGGEASKAELTTTLKVSLSGPAREKLLREIMTRQVARSTLREAWLEREAGRWGVTAEEFSTAFDQYVVASTAVTDYQNTTTRNDRFGGLKRGLLTSRDLVYNRDAATLGHVLFNGRLQCRSGSIAVVLAWTIIAGDDGDARLAFVHSPGHVRPGFVVEDTVYFVEATALDAVVLTSPLAAVTNVRVTDAMLELAIELVGDEAPQWMRQQALIVDALNPANAQTLRLASADGQTMDAGKMPFAFGSVDLPKGDLPLGLYTAQASDVFGIAPSGSFTADYSQINRAGKQRAHESEAAVQSTHRGDFGRIHKASEANTPVDGTPERASPQCSVARAHVTPNVLGKLQQAAYQHGLMRWERLVGRVHGTCAVVTDPESCDERSIDSCSTLLLIGGGSTWRVHSSGRLSDLEVPAECARGLTAPAQFCAMSAYLRGAQGGR